MKRLWYTEHMKMGGKTGLRQEGFTIVEVLIVLAITGVLFLVAALYLSGKQSKTEFAVGIRQVQQQFQQIINETQSGYYPNNGDFVCLAGALKPLTIKKPGATQQGTNGQCTFIGKAIVAGGDTHKSNLRVIPLAGKRLDNAGADITSVVGAWPTAIAPGTVTNSGPNGAPDMSTIISLPSGIQFAGGTETDGTGTLLIPTIQFFPIALVSSLAGFSANGTNGTATQTFSLYGFHPAAWLSPIGSTQEIDAINNEAVWNPKLTQATYCFASGGTNQSGLITIGDKAGGLSVTLDIKTGTAC